MEVTNINDKLECKLVDKSSCEQSKYHDIQQVAKDQVLRNTNKVCQDMNDLDELNHATVLNNLYERYKMDKFYTYVGPTLVTVNPFK